MKIHPNRLYAILTGDIVGSARYRGDSRRRLHDAITTAGRDTRTAFGQSIPREVDFFRGDSWQCLVTDPEKSLRIALYFRATFRQIMQNNAADTRLAIGIGSLDFVPDNGISAGDGEAYRLSGSLIDRMSAHCRMALGLSPSLNGTPIAASGPVIVQLVDALVQQWTSRQAKAVCGALRNLSQKEIAEHTWGEVISQQAVAQHLQKAGWHAVQQALDCFEEYLKNFE